MFTAGRRKRRRNLQRGRNIPVRTFTHWNRPPPSFLEIDLVAYCGESMGGSFVYSLVAREQSLVVAGLEATAPPVNGYAGPKCGGDLHRYQTSNESAVPDEQSPTPGNNPQV